MGEELSMPVNLPLDSDGFLRRECPTCERQFKRFSGDEDSGEAGSVEQYFCPLCGVPAAVSAWSTTEQLEYAKGVAAPEIDRLVRDSIADAFKGIKGVSFKASGDFSLGLDIPPPLTEPDDMVIVEPPCHPNDPVKVPEGSLGSLHCLICGDDFAA
jgi:hypothetical protein